MTFCRSRAAAAKKWIKKRDLAIEFLFCLLKLRLIVFNFWCSRYRRRRGILNSVFILPKRLNHGINFLSPKYSLILNSWLLKLIIGASTLSAAICSTRQYMRSKFLVLSLLHLYSIKNGWPNFQWHVVVKVLWWKSWSRWPFFHNAYECYILKIVCVIFFQCVKSTFETTVFCLKYSREVQFLLNFATIQCLLMKRNSNLLIA